MHLVPILNDCNSTNIDRRKTKNSSFDSRNNEVLFAVNVITLSAAVLELRAIKVILKHIHVVSVVQTYCKRPLLVLIRRVYETYTMYMDLPDLLDLSTTQNPTLLPLTNTNTAPSTFESNFPTLSKAAWYTLNSGKYEKVSGCNGSNDIIQWKTA